MHSRVREIREQFDRDVAGAKDAAARARDVAHRKLSEFEPPPLDDAVREELAEYVTRRRRELGD